MIAYQNPSALFMHSGANETKTDGELGQMGQALAHEIQEFLTELEQN